MDRVRVQHKYTVHTSFTVFVHCTVYSTVYRLQYSTPHCGYTLRYSTVQYKYSRIYCRLIIQYSTVQYSIIPEILSRDALPVALLDSNPVQVQADTDTRTPNFVVLANTIS